MENIKLQSLSKCNRKFDIQSLTDHLLLYSLSYNYNLNLNFKSKYI